MSHVIISVLNIDFENFGLLYCIKLKQAICGKFDNIDSKLGKQTVSIPKKTLREFDSMKDYLEQVRNDAEVTNKKLSALYKFKIDSAENK